MSRSRGIVPVPRDDVTVTRPAWGIVRQRCGVQLQHPMLHVPFRSLDGTDDARTVAEAFEEFERLGLARDGRAGEQAVNLFTLLAAPKRELHGSIGYHDGATAGVVAASDGEQAVRVLAVDDLVHVNPVEPTKLAESIMMVLPEFPPAPSGSLSVPREHYDEIYREPDPATDAVSFLVRADDTDRKQADAEELRRRLAQPRHGGGRFHAAARDGMGGTTTSRYPLTYLDLAGGRCFLRDTPNGLGRLWVTMAPAPIDVLLHELRALLAGRSGGR